MTCGIYKITSPSGNFYVGSSKDIERRCQIHLASLKRGKHHSVALQRAWERHHAMRPEVILVCREQDLIFYEQACINGLQPAYNSSRIAGRVEMTPERRAKISAALTGRHLSEERVQMMRGRKASAETRARISRVVTGRVVGPKTRAKISAAKLGIKRPASVGDAVARANALRVHSPESNLKRSLALKGKPKPRKVDHVANGV